MKFSAAFVAFVAGAVSFVNAQQSDAGIFFTHPVLGSNFAANTAQNITWTVINPAATNITNIELRKGNAENLDFVQNISNEEIPVSRGFYQWVVPQNLTTDTSYAIIAKNQQGGATYSAYFTILATPPGLNPPVSDPSPAPAPAPAPAAAASSAASSA
ncbi:hypothetical protein BDF20DRAFT_911653 [Mycotypha africana]|uniref:uncharacterized protein n=1 Tax=Mycotypha africana TaxID=64632 RepID=UPI002301716E|nr:uncharacterized protein BDF20DRAFT_911653 [Mycotypha africana]KAI8984567.1 hypothetical protein BDF20DRAFT_911653 [Mycotypha africana]